MTMVVPNGARAAHRLLAAALLVPAVIHAQGQPVQLSLSGPAALTSTGALRCAVGEEVQLALAATDSIGQATALERYAPVATSSDTVVLIAQLPASSVYAVHVRCLKDGAAVISVRANGVLTSMQALVGTARNQATTAATRGVVSAGPGTQVVRGTTVTAQGRQRALPVGWSVRVNGQPLTTTTVLASTTRQGQGTASDYFVSVDDLSRALGGTATAPTLRLHGNTLVSLPITVRPTGSGAVDSLDNFRPGGTTSGTTQLPITVRTGGVISSNVQIIDGKAYIPISDVASALGGTTRLDNGQIDITTGACATCALAPTRSP
jgi:hypothetical protein